DSHGDAALTYSAEFKHPRLTKLLLDAGANPDTQNNWKQSPLMKCAINRNWASMKMLLEKKATVDLASPDGTPLLYAAGHGDITGVHLLLAHGANVNARNTKYGITP